MKAGKKVLLLYAPTGAGKTVILSQVIADANAKNRRILFLVHRNELVQQTVDTLARFELEAGVIKAGWEANPERPIQIASIQTLNKRGLPKDLDVVIIDECHTTSYFKTCSEILKKHDGFVIGVTATPWRLKKSEGLKEYYQDIVKAPMPGELIKMGFLVPPEYYGYSNEIDLSSVSIMAGEYANQELDVVCNTPAVILRIVEEFKRLAENRTAICFTINVAHAKNIARAFNQSGIAADSIEASTPHSTRRDLYQKLDEGKIQILCSVGVLTEGFDVKSIGGIILARPTKSMALNFQMVGRGLRICPERDKKDCIVIDFSNNTERHGMVQYLEEVEMDTPNLETGKAPAKSCPNCNFVVPLGTEECPKCGHKFDMEVEKETQKRERLDDLIKLLPHDEKKRRKLYHQYAQYAYHNGMKPTWAAVKYHGKYRKWPKPIYKRAAVFGEEPSSDDKMAYLNYLLGFLERGEVKNPNDYVEMHMKGEFGDEWNVNTENSSN